MVYQKLVYGWPDYQMAPSTSETTQNTPAWLSRQTDRGRWVFAVFATCPSEWAGIGKALAPGHGCKVDPATASFF